MGRLWERSAYPSSGPLFGGTKVDTQKEDEPNDDQVDEDYVALMQNRIDRILAKCPEIRWMRSASRCLRIIL